jgi:nitrous oxidase accessory protein NosD
MKGLRLLAVTFTALALSLYFTTVAVAKDFCASTAVELQAFLTEAIDNGQDDTIRIVQGTYNGNFIYASTESYGVTLEGGYSPGCASRTVDPNNTVLDAGGSGTVLALSAPSAVADFVVDGLTIKNGHNATSNGGGIYINTNAGDVSVSNNNIIDNYARSFGGLFIKKPNNARINKNKVNSNASEKSNTSCISIHDASSIIEFIDNIISNNNDSGIFVGGTPRPKSI